MNELPQTACLVVNPARVDKFAFRQDRPQTLWQFLLKDLSTDERGGAWCCVCGQAVGFLLLWYSVKCWVLILVLSSFCITRRCRHAPISKGSFMLPNIYVSWSTSELSVRLVPLNMFNPSSILFYWPFQGGASSVDPFLLFVFLVCFCYTACINWPLGFLCVMFSCVFVNFSYGVPGQVWYSIVLIPDLCLLPYFVCLFDLILYVPSTIFQL